MNREQAKELLPVIEAYSKGEEIQQSFEDLDEPRLEGWQPVLKDAHFDSNAIKFRIKPKTRLINGVECPMPLTSLSGLSAIFAVDFAMHDLFFEWSINLSSLEQPSLALEIGFAFDTKEGAITTAKAILKGLEI